MAAAIDCLVVQSGSFSAFCCLLQILGLSGLVLFRRSLVAVRDALPFLSEWETVEIIYGVRTRWRNMFPGK